MSDAIWVALIVTIGAMVSAGATAWVATHELSLKRKLDGTSSFVQLFEIAHGRSRPLEEGGVGTGEQVAAIALVADLATEYKWLRRAARDGLREIATVDLEVVRSAAERALRTIPS